MLLTQLIKKNKCGETPLYWAVLLGNAEIVKILLENGADPNLENTNGETPLCTAISKSRLDLVRILLAKGADRNKPSKDGYPYTIAKKVGNKRVIQHLEIFDRLQDVPESHNSYVLIRYWPPKVGPFTNVPYLAAILFGYAGLGNVGHISMAIRNGETELYMSHWPIVPSSKKAVPSCNNKLKRDLNDEGSDPSKYIALYGLDTKKIIEKYKEIINRPWSMIGNKKNQNAYSCASAVYELLSAGGLFDFYLNDKDKLKGPLKPSQVLDLCLKAQLNEQTYFLSAPDRLLRTIEHEFIQAANAGTECLGKFKRRKQDYENFYKKSCPEYEVCFENINAKAQRMDDISIKELTKLAKLKAQEGSYKWNKYLQNDPLFNRSINKYVKNNVEFKRELEEIKSRADEKQSKKLLTIIDNLKDTSKAQTEKQKIKAEERNEVMHENFDRLMKNPNINIFKTDDSGLNVLHKAILKNDAYCVEKIIDNYPEACNVKVQPGINRSISAGIFSNLNKVSGYTPLDLARYINSPILISLLEQNIDNRKLQSFT